MHRFYKFVVELSQDRGFFTFQNEVVHAAYQALGRGYAANENEVAIVARLVAALDGRSYGRIHISGSRIHGSRSYVEFSLRDKPATKELGDMAVVAVVTSGRSRLAQRVCIIQNKKAKDGTWGVDPEQLFLLKNFPPLTGNRGVLRGTASLAFRNRSGCLGAYGLLAEPGEMLFIAAPLLAEVLRGRAAICARDVGILPPVLPGSRLSPFSASPFGVLAPDPEEWDVIMSEIFGPITTSRWRWLAMGFPFLANVQYGRDVYDFVRAWTQMSIGELTCVGGAIVNSEVDSFANLLIRSAQLGGDVHFPVEGLDVERGFDGDVAVLLLLVDVEDGGRIPV